MGWTACRLSRTQIFWSCPPLQYTESPRRSGQVPREGCAAGSVHVDRFMAALLPLSEASQANMLALIRDAVKVGGLNDDGDARQRALIDFTRQETHADMIEEGGS